MFKIRISDASIEWTYHISGPEADKLSIQNFIDSAIADKDVVITKAFLSDKFYQPFPFMAKIRYRIRMKIKRFGWWLFCKAN